MHAVVWRGRGLVCANSFKAWESMVGGLVVYDCIAHTAG
jgi:hypothetical protein